MKSLLHQGPLRRSPSRGVSFRLLTTMAEELAEAEGPYDRFHAAPTQRRMDLAGEHAGRGAGDHDLGLFGVHDPAHEALPARDELDLIEEPVPRLAIPQLRVAAVVLLEQERELICCQIGEPVGIETQEDRALRRQASPPGRE